MRKPTENEKCIVLAKANTEQVKELQQAALADGFAEGNIITITTKESATEIRQAITDDPTISTVYVREVSRIGRRYDVLVSMKAFFVGNKIQLVVCGESRQELLNADGSISFLGKLVLVTE